MDIEAFGPAATGDLVPIEGHSPRWGSWRHVAFVPHPLPGETPPLSAVTHNAVARARAALASLDGAARHLPDPSLLRRSTLQVEAQSTSALEGTYAPLEDVLAADEDDPGGDPALGEVLNFVRTAEHAFDWWRDGRPMTVTLLTELQQMLLRGTAAESDQTGRIRTIEVMIGGHPAGRVQDATFVPSPPGPGLEQKVRDWATWITTPRGLDIDPVVAAAMGHHHFETLHPFHDGNGRIGRLMIVLQLLYSRVLAEPTLTVSPWFEERRAEYFDGLLAVSTRGDWNSWIRFFADGLALSARDTEVRLLALLEAQAALKARIRAAGLRADNAVRLVDFALKQPIFTVRQVERSLDITYVRANGLVGQLMDLGVLRQFGDARYAREFTAPEFLAVLMRPQRVLFRDQR